MEFTVAELAERVGGRVVGDGTLRLSGIAAPARAGAGELAVVTRGTDALAGCAAGCVVLPQDADAGDRTAILHADPRYALALAIGAFHPAERAEPGVSEHAWVHPSATLGEGVSVGPFAVVERDAELGAGAAVGAGAYVGAGVRIGAGTVLHPRCTVYARSVLGRDCVVHAGAVLGADGFGFTFVEGRHLKIPQVGGLEIGDDVEIGANSCVDGGTLEPTRVGDNTKIDDLVMVGHNNQLGRSVLLCGLAGLAGSNVLGDYVVVAGQAGVSGHLTVGARATVAAKAAVMRDVPEGEVVAGVPDMPIVMWRRVSKASRRLPEMRAELRELRKRVTQLEERLAKDDAD